MVGFVFAFAYFDLDLLAEIEPWQAVEEVFGVGAVVGYFDLELLP